MRRGSIRQLSIFSSVTWLRRLAFDTWQGSFLLRYQDLGYRRVPKLLLAAQVLGHDLQHRMHRHGTFVAGADGRCEVAGVQELQRLPEVVTLAAWHCRDCSADLTIANSFRDSHIYPMRSIRASSLCLQPDGSAARCKGQRSTDLP
ncbi:protein of unknown function [Aminobacter niigataensis]|nr:protein of unknown function [Aminobacter niigataensis]